MTSPEIIGMINAEPGSEAVGYGKRTGNGIDPDYIRESARAHEAAGFDRVLIGYSSVSPDGFAIAQTILQETTSLKVLIAHRPGFVAPTVQARKLATLDHLTGGGRVAIHHISGGSDFDQQRDGDFVSKDARYARTAEFIQILRRALGDEAPFSFSGEYYSIAGFESRIKPATDAGIPIFFGGQSDAAVQVGGQHADTFALFGEPLKDTAERIRLIEEIANAHGNQVDYSLSTRPVVAETEDLAWAKAESIASNIAALKAERTNIGPLLERKRPGDAAVSNRRLREHAQGEEVYDDRLWFGATRSGGYGGNSSGHVGTADQVADSLIRYWDLGVRKFLIRGFDPLEDVKLWGDGLIPALRRRIGERTEASAVA